MNASLFVSRCRGPAAAPYIISIFCVSQARGNSAWPGAQYDALPPLQGRRSVVPRLNDLGSAESRQPRAVDRMSLPAQAWSGSASTSCRQFHRPAMSRP
jgi:hypothetical protein